MSKRGIDKQLLSNYIRQAGTLNKLHEERVMWSQRGLERGMEVHSHGGRERRRDREGMMARGRLVSDSLTPPPPDPAPAPSSYCWTKRLMKEEERDPLRWGHSGYKELHPEEFASSDEEDEEESERRKNKKKRKKKHRKKERHKKRLKRKPPPSQGSSESESEDCRVASTEKRTNGKLKSDLSRVDDSSVVDDSSGSHRKSRLRKESCLWETEHRKRQRRKRLRYEDEGGGGGGRGTSGTDSSDSSGSSEEERERRRKKRRRRRKGELTTL